MPETQDLWPRCANEQRAVTVVMAAAPCHRLAFKAGARVCLGHPQHTVLIRLLQYVSAGPYHTSSGPQESLRPFRRKLCSGHAFAFFHNVRFRIGSISGWNSFRVHSFRGLLFVRDFFALSVESSFFPIPKLDFVIAYCRTRRTPAGRTCTTCRTRYLLFFKYSF